MLTSILTLASYFFLAHQCPSYQHFLAGKCFKCKAGSGNCALMGYHTDSSPGLENEISPTQQRFHDTIGTKFFTSTGREFPYCRKYNCYICFKVTPCMELSRSFVSGEYSVGKACGGRTVGTGVHQSIPAQPVRGGPSGPDSRRGHEAGARYNSHHSCITSG